MTQIDVFSGFLGAGKTTLIKKMIREAYRGEKLVLIENEFGQVGVDGSFLREQGLRISEINSGCICCSLSGDFSDAIRQAAADWQPDRILIEPSGVGKLSEILAAVDALCREYGHLARGAAVTVVDAARCAEYLSGYSAFYENQVAAADLLILSRTQTLPDAKVAAAVQALREINAGARLVTTPWDQLTGAQICAAARGSSELADTLRAELADGVCANAHDVHDHDAHDHDGCRHADELFQSWSAETPRAAAKAAIEAILSELDTGKYGAVLRAKGVLMEAGAADGQWLAFDYVPGEHSIRQACPDVTGKLCVIGVGLDKRALSMLFPV